MAGRALATASGGLVLAVLAAKLWLAGALPLLTDECLYWVWSLHPAAGYFDQPPAIAWSLAASRVVIGDSPTAIRLAPLLMGALIPLILARWSGDRWRWTLWAVSLPVLFGLTFVATPDAWLLGAWALALAGALHGGRGWLLAGVATGLAGLAKYSGLAVLPLALLAVGPREWRSRWPWLGVSAAVGLMLPNLWWNLEHDWLTFAFQWGEGIAHPHPPGLSGAAAQALGQVAVVGPPAALAATWWAVRTFRAEDRTDRICWFTSVPLLAFFALAAIGGPPEAHWPAPAWISLGLGLSRDPGRPGRLAEMGAWFGLLMTGAAALHCFRPLLPVVPDPASRFWEAPTLAAPVAQWALPVGPRPGAPLRPVLTERYQEAAAIAYYARIEARVLPGCGRPNQYDLWPAADPASALFVRPSTGGPPDCLGGRWTEVRGPNRIHPVDPVGRPTGRWQVFELGPPVD